eukprot:tig00001107_g7092.t1
MADRSESAAAREAVFQRSGELPPEVPERVEVRGYDFNRNLGAGSAPVSVSELLSAYASTGFQATALAEAADVLDKMLSWRLSDEPIAEDESDEFRDPARRAQVRCKVFLGYTSNMISCGLREAIRFLAQHKLIDAIVTTAGGVEEDIIKCLAPFYLGKFELKGEELRSRGLNRIGNLLVPNDNYCKFEDWVVPILDKLVEEQKQQGIVWSPSKIINRLGKEINDPSSVYFWCYKNDIPVYCPAFTDGSLGDMIYFHSFKNPGLVVDIVSDLRAINSSAVYARKTGMIILGGGVIKHHVCNANLMRNGADFAVYINTASEFDGSDAGARPDEAVSWGKIRAGARAVKVHGDATLIFPLLIANSMLKHVSSTRAVNV